ncbi:ROK family protein [Candidatus Microgenomates bacterium]|nr:MAG: ROK family protein [Candidatus Microgenomates bacterium]
MYVGIDIGATHTRVALAVVPNNIVQKKDFATTSFRETIARIVESIRLLAPEKIEAIGISSPAPLNKVQGTILNTPNLPNWKDKPLVDMLKQELHCPVYLEHDASAGALAEFLYGQKSANPLLYLTLSTGIGGGLIKEGQIYEGTNSIHLGHQVIDKKGPKCSCGKNGCLEAFVSGWAIEKKFGKPAQEIDDPAVWDEVGENLAVGINNSVMHYLPELIVLGGGLIQKGDLLLKPLQKHLEQYFCQDIPLPSIELARLGQDSSLIGALAIAWKKYNNK